MGYLVEKLSGMSFGEFLRTRLFEPLGMTDTAFYVPPEKIDRFSSCYQPKEGGGAEAAGRRRQEHLRQAARCWNPAAAAWSRPSTTTCASAA